MMSIGSVIDNTGVLEEKPPGEGGRVRITKRVKNRGKRIPNLTRYSRDLWVRKLKNPTLTIRPHENSKKARRSEGLTED